MKANQLCFLVVLCLLPALCLAGSNSGESGEQKKRTDDCGPLVQEPAEESTPAAPTRVPTPAPGLCYCTPAPEDKSGEGFQSKCPLIKAFHNMTSDLDEDEQVEWEDWIAECENSYLANSSLSDEDKLVAISVSFKAFCKSHKSIHKKISHKKIGEWGVSEDFLYLHISIKIKVTQSICTLDASGSCEVLQALQNVSESFSADDQEQVDILIEEIRSCLEDDSYNYQQKLGKVHKKCKDFFEKNRHLEKSVKECHIKGYASFEVFLSICETYYSIVNVKAVLEGTSVDDCEFLASWDNVTNDVSLPTTYRTQLKEMKGKYETFFKGTVDINLRIKYVSRACYNASSLMPWLVSIYEDIECGGDWGNVYRMIFCSGVCSLDGCGDLNQGPGPNYQVSSAAPSTAAHSSAASSTPSPTTAASSSPRPTTAASSSPPPTTAASSSPRPTTAASSTAAPVATTTQKPADCSTVGSLIAVDSNNKTVLTDVLTQNYNTWNATMKLGFNTCFNNVRQGIWDNTNYPSQASKLAKCKKSFMEYNANNLEKQKVVLDIRINIWVGTIGQFCNCIN